MARQDFIIIGAICVIVLAAAVLIVPMFRPDSSAERRLPLPGTPVLPDPPGLVQPVAHNLRLEVTDALTGARIESGTVVTLRNDSGFQDTLTGSNDGTPLLTLAPVGALTVEVWRERCAPQTLVVTASQQPATVRVALHVARRVSVNCNAPCWVVAYSDAPPEWPETRPFSRAVFATAGRAEFWLTPGSYWCAIGPANTEIPEAELDDLTFPSGTAVVALEVAAGETTVTAPGPVPGESLQLGLHVEAEFAAARVDLIRLGPGPLRRLISSQIARANERLEIGGLAPGVYLAEGASRVAYGQALIDLKSSTDARLLLKKPPEVCHDPSAVGSIRVLKFGRQQEGVQLRPVAYFGLSSATGTASMPVQPTDGDRPLGGITFGPGPDQFGSPSDAEGLVHAPASRPGQYTLAARGFPHHELEVIYDPGSERVADFELCPPGTGEIRLDLGPDSVGRRFTLVDPTDGFELGSFQFQFPGIPAGQYTLVSWAPAGDAGDLPFTWPVSVTPGETTVVTPAFAMRALRSSWPRGDAWSDDVMVHATVGRSMGLASPSQPPTQFGRSTQDALLLVAAPTSAFRLHVSATEWSAWADVPAREVDITELAWDFGPDNRPRPRARYEWLEAMRNTYGTPYALLAERRAAALETDVTLPTPTDLPRTPPNTRQRQPVRDPAAVWIYVTGATADVLWLSCLNVLEIDLSHHYFHYLPGLAARPRLVQREGRLALVLRAPLAGTFELTAPHGRGAKVRVPSAGTAVAHFHR